jgi:uncharacterized protein DUF2490
MVMFLLLISCVRGHAQIPPTEYLPELDAHVSLNSNVRLVAQDKTTLDGSGVISKEVGPSVEFYLRPIRILRDITLFDLDETKPRPLTISIGYRVLVYPAKPKTHRLEPVVIVHLPFFGRILATDQNRADIDWTNDRFYWRYRNRLTTERRVTIYHYRPGPYVSAEFFYASKYAKWENTRLYAGCLLPLGRHFDLDPYYEHDNDTGLQPNRQIRVVGFTLNFYLSNHWK